MTTVAPETKLGPYEILSPLGAGGMGEVWRARDARLKRDVAIKVLPAAFASDAERLRRFEQEAQAASALNHPNILSIYDLGTHDGAPYIVSELLEGETLRAALAEGALAPRRAIGYAAQIARGLAAAHEKGIVHRDLKPENVFVTDDGRVKILDFGLARVTLPEGGSASAGATNLPTVSPGTEPGVVLGTLGYMAPEQLRGRTADGRSDIFAFGAILYEMLAGRRAFSGDSAADTISAILTKDPPELLESNRAIPESLDRIARHCLEKKPEARFQSASDIAFDLESVSGNTGAGASARPLPVRPTRSWIWPLVLVAVAVVALAAGSLLDRTTRKSGPPTYRQLTFRRGRVMNARFSPDGQTVLYDAMWGAEPVRIFSLRPGSPESSTLSLPEAFLYSVSSKGEIAVGLRPNLLEDSIPATLASAALSGGAPREILDGVAAADFAPDGQELAVVHMVGERTRLEFPIGKVLFETNGRIWSVKVSPRSDLVAFSLLPVLGDSIGSILIADRQGRVRTLSEGWSDLNELVWSRSGEEIWFSASRTGVRDSLWAVTVSGKLRLLAESPGSLRLHAIAPDGRVLVTLASYRCSIVGVAPGETAERDFSWLDFSYPIDLSKDGKALLFEEWGEGGGPAGSVYLRRFDGSPPVRLGEGLALGLSPDGKWALTRLYTEPPKLVLLPTGVGSVRAIPPANDLHYEEWGRFLPDGRRIVFRASQRGRGPRLYVQDLEGGAPRPFTAEGAVGLSGPDVSGVSPDGRWVMTAGAAQTIVLFPIEGGEPHSIPGTDRMDFASQWTADGKSVYLVRAEGGAVLKIYRVDLATGHHDLIREFRPDPAGFMLSTTSIVVSPDGRSTFWGFQHRANELYLAEGLK